MKRIARSSIDGWNFDITIERLHLIKELLGGYIGVFKSMYKTEGDRKEPKGQDLRPDWSLRMSTDANRIPRKMSGPKEKPRCQLVSNGYIFRRPFECSKTCNGIHYEKGRYGGTSYPVCKKILTTEERIAKEKYDKERNEWLNATPDTCQHNWESDEDYAKRLEQSFEDYKKRKGVS